MNKTVRAKAHFKYKGYDFLADGRIYSTFKGGYFLKLKPKKVGYVSITIRRDKGLYETRYVHRLVWEAFNGEIPKGLEINHKNGIKHDNRLENLELVTKSENLKHAVYKLGHKPHENFDHDHELKELRRSVALILLSNDWTQSQIAKALGVSQPQVSSYLK